MFSFKGLNDKVETESGSVVENKVGGNGGRGKPEAETEKKTTGVVTF